MLALALLELCLMVLHPSLITLPLIVSYPLHIKNTHNKVCNGPHAPPSLHHCYTHHSPFGSTLSTTASLSLPVRSEREKREKVRQPGHSHTLKTAIFSTLQQLTAHTPGHLHPPNMEKSCSKSPPTTWQGPSVRRPHPFLSAAPHS